MASVTNRNLPFRMWNVQGVESTKWNVRNERLKWKV